MEQGKYDSVLLEVEECEEIDKRRIVLLSALDKFLNAKERTPPLKPSLALKAFSKSPKSSPKCSPKSSPSACSTRPKLSLPKACTRSIVYFLTCHACKFAYIWSGTLRASFSAVSTPIFASKCSLDSILRDLL